jgi:hypothetical protein
MEETPNSLLSSSAETRIRTHTYDFVFTDVKADFKLAPQTLVVHKRLSFFGGMWEDDKDEIVKVPKSITPDDVSTVF